MNRLLTSLIVVLAATNLSAREMSELPRLVVAITVDQLRGDYLNYLYQAFGEKGFKRLIENGLLYENVVFDMERPDGTAAMATLFSGAYPNLNGVVGANFFNTSNLRTEGIFNDIKYMGNFTAQTVSPKRLLCSTVTDELKVASDGLSRVYSIAPNMEQALVGAGHAADGAFWIDDINGKWATTTFYKDVPYFIDRYNRTDAPDQRIADAVWEPMLPVSEYRFIPYMASDWSFKHTFGRIKKDQYKVFKTSALVNDEVNRFVELLLKEGGIAKNSNPDFLSVTYNVGPFLGGSDGVYSLETQDAYMRLDRSLGNLLDIIDKSVGLQNTYIFLASTGCTDSALKPGERYQIPTGEFHPDRCTALLNTYLMALYGQQNWVLGYHDQQIFLNRRLIEDKKVDINEIQTKAAEFVIQFSGVQDVITAHQLLHGNWNEKINRYRNGFHRKLSGDLILAVEPGWSIVTDSYLNQQHTVRLDGIPAPLIIYGPQLGAEKVSRVIDATELAPTVSRVLRIRSPNACTALPLAEVDRMVGR